jgi:hypothetical protein
MFQSKNHEAMAMEVASGQFGGKTKDRLSFGCGQLLKSSKIWLRIYAAIIKNRRKRR